ncbi:MAG: hypothetical protein IRY89_12665 [Pseudolabrys sp.]|nr:hypothetical protein [Pseudolabrys sp.]
MRRLVAMALAWLGAMPAAAASAEDVMREFHLFGTWAVDCSKPASPANPHVSDANPSPGLVLEDQDLGPERVVNRYTIVGATRLSDTRLSLDVIFRPGEAGAQRQRLELVVRDGTRRTVFNQPEGGPVRVRNGRVIGFGTKTPVLTKCR